MGGVASTAAHRPTWWARFRSGLRAKTLSRLPLVWIFDLARRCDTGLFRKIRFQVARDHQPLLLASDGPEHFVVLTSDTTISRAVYVRGEFEFDKVKKTIGLLGPDFHLDLLVDVGANIGTVCVPAVKRGLAKRAIAIEPEPTNFAVLVANVHLNGLAAAITTHHAALGDADGQTLTLELSPDNSGDHRIAASGAAQSGESMRAVVAVRSETFDSLVPALAADTSLIWMDTQGYEGFILSGARRAVAQRVPLVVEFWPFGIEQAGCYPLLQQAMLHYAHYYDLADPQPRAVPVSKTAIDALRTRLNARGGHTDLLLV
jgi:FkbM family methyltransferase